MALAIGKEDYDWENTMLSDNSFKGTVLQKVSQETNGMKMEHMFKVASPPSCLLIFS